MAWRRREHRVGHRAHSVHGPGQRKLRRAESLDKVTAPALPGLLQRAITMPCRSSKASALACSLRVWSGSTGGSSDQRPLTVGGPACDGSDPRPKPGRWFRRPAEGPGLPNPGRPPGGRPAAGAWPLPALFVRPFSRPVSPSPPDPVPVPEAGPWPGPASPAGRGPGTHDLPAESSVRNGAMVSLVTRPAHTRSQMAAAIAWSVTRFSALARPAASRPSAPSPSGELALLGFPAVNWSTTRSARARKNSAPPPLRTESTTSCTGVIVISPGGGSSSGAESAGARTSHPSPPGSAPAPAQTTSPAAVSSSSMAGA